MAQSKKQKSDEIRRVGRPTEEVPKRLADDLIAWLMQGRPLRQWCEIDGNAHFTTVYAWRKKDPEFALRFNEAKTAGCEAIADECRMLAAERPEDQLELNWKKVQIDLNLRLMSKWDPAGYGDKQQVEHNGGIQIVLKTNVPEPDGT